MPSTNNDLFEQYGFSRSEKRSDAPDFGDFLSGAPQTITESDVEAEEEAAEEVTIGEAYIAPAGAPAVDMTDPDMDYMGNMQNMFKSLALDTTEEEAAAEAEVAAVEEPADPEPELSSFLFGPGGEPPVRTDADLLTGEEPTVPDARNGVFRRNTNRKKKTGLQLNPELLEQSKK